MDSPLAPIEEGEWMVSKEYVRTRPLASISMNDPVRILSEKLRAFMEKVKTAGPDPFFHRKSDRVVLSVLQCRLPDGTDAWFEGINGEVSLPTGSLCSERAAIAHARARHPDITRACMKAIAVLEVPLLFRGSSEEGAEASTDNPLWPCGACMEWLKKIQEKVENFRVLAYSSTNMEYVTERYLFLAQTVADIDFTPQELGQWSCPDCKAINPQLTVVCDACGRDRWQGSVTLTAKQQKKRCRDLRRLLEALDKEQSLLPAESVASHGVPLASWRRRIPWLPSTWVCNLESHGYVKAHKWTEVTSPSVGPSEDNLADGYSLTLEGDKLRRGDIDLRQMEILKKGMGGIAAASKALRNTPKVHHAGTPAHAQNPRKTNSVVSPLSKPKNGGATSTQSGPTAAAGSKSRLQQQQQAQSLPMTPLSLHATAASTAAPVSLLPTALLDTPPQRMVVPTYPPTSAQPTPPSDTPASHKSGPNTQTAQKQPLIQQQQQQLRGSAPPQQPTYQQQPYLPQQQQPPLATAAPGQTPQFYTMPYQYFQYVQQQLQHGGGPTTFPNQMQSFHVVPNSNQSSDPHQGTAVVQFGGFSGAPSYSSSSSALNLPADGQSVTPHGANYGCVNIAAAAAQPQQQSSNFHQ